MSETADSIPRATVETLIMDQHQNTLAIVDAPLWPPRGAVIELGDPTETPWSKVFGCG